MPFYLRKVRFNKWIKSQCPSWVRGGEAPGDPVIDLVTVNNELSLWEVDDEQANLDRVIAAMAATRDTLDEFAFILVDRQHIDALALPFARQAGESPDDFANENWHHNLPQGTASMVSTLTTVFWNRGKDVERRMPPKITALIVSGVKSGNLRVEAMKPKLQDQVKKLL